MDAHKEQIGFSHVFWMDRMPRLWQSIKRQSSIKSVSNNSRRKFMSRKRLSSLQEKPRRFCRRHTLWIRQLEESEALTSYWTPRNDQGCIFSKIEFSTLRYISMLFIDYVIIDNNLYSVFGISNAARFELKSMQSLLRTNN